jgi:hypothetical protein
MRYEKEDFKNLPIRDLLGIEVYFDGFGVICDASNHQRVLCSSGGAPGIS